MDDHDHLEAMITIVSNAQAGARLLFSHSGWLGVA
jgi:hypothetical protein